MSWATERGSSKNRSFGEREKGCGAGRVANCGFTVIELSVSILVLLVGILAASTAIVHAGRIASASAWRQHATAVAELALAQVRTQPFGQLVQLQADKTHEYSLDIDGDGKGERTYQWNAAVDVLGPSLARVTIRVRYDDARLGELEFEASTLVTDHLGVMR